MSAGARIWLALGFLVAGVVFGEDGGLAAAGLWLAGAGAGALVVRRRLRLRLVGLASVAFGFGLVVSSTIRAVDPLARAAESYPSCELDGTVVEHAGGLGTLVAVETGACRYVSVAPAGIVIVDGTAADPGARVHLSGRLEPLHGDGFERARARLGASAALDGDVQMTAKPGTPLRSLSASLREALRRSTSDARLRAGPLIRGLTVGDTEALDAETVERFRRSGLAHLVAVSGSNVAIVVGAVLFLARRASLLIRTVVASGSLFVFLLVVGPEPSVLRAVAMGGIALAALMLGRRSEPLQALGLALIIVIAARPGLAFSIGMHLSAAATAGIALWTAPLTGVLSFLPRAPATALAATLAAQLAVAPILIAAFEQISVIAPAANLLALPAVAPATILGMGAGIAGVFNEGAGRVVARMADPFAAWIMEVAEVCGDLGWAAFSLPRGASAVAAVPALAFAVASLRSPRWGISLRSMDDMRWVLLDAEGNEMRASEPFASKEEAEEWMGREWSALLEEGAEYVSLRADGKQLYRMGLRAE